MLRFEKMWKNIKMCKKSKRYLKHVNYAEINLNEYIIIDVRNRREFREKHINGAINIPISELKRNITKYVKNKEKKILVYCQSGARSTKAAEILEEMGYLQVYNLKGGLENI